MSYRETHAWREAFASFQTEGSEKDAQDRLASAFDAFRTKAAYLAGEIRRDLPNFTLHDVSHLDRLWSLIDLVRGDGQTLNPAEGFVLGGAILIHDLGLALASYPGGAAELRSGDEWDDVLAATLARRFGRMALRAEIENADDAAVAAATAELLRLRHAERAEVLCQVKWRRGGEQHHLVDSPELRDHYGRTIGLVAASHGRPAAAITDFLPVEVSAAASLPASWKVNPLKLACLLRAADACHLDGARAPAFLAAATDIAVESREYWAFQSKLGRPTRLGDRVVFSSGAAFDRDEAGAWWLCYSTLNMVNRELFDTNALLDDLGQDRLAVIGVLGAEEPARMTQWLPTDGWLPIDAQMHVSDLPALIKSLGGEALYGRDLHAPLRELMQNAADAVRARRIVDGRAADWGTVEVRLGQQADRWWVEVQDEGVGMSSEALARGLLNFGTSYWYSERARREHPGLMAAGYQPTGRYGIGFFSVFMLGNAVEVISRRYDAAQSETYVLSFSRGVQGRPLLRTAEPAERLSDGGTTIRIWLDRDPRAPGGLLDDVKTSLAGFVAYLAPALDVAVEVVDESGTRELAVAANDWLEMDGLALATRLAGMTDYFESAVVNSDPDDVLGRDRRWAIDQLAHNLRILRDDRGVPLGRACILPILHYGESAIGSMSLEPGLTTIGGFRGSELVGAGGILLGTPLRASRDQARPVVSLEELGRWATQQGELVQEGPASVLQRFEAARIVYGCGGSLGDLPVLHYEGNWLSLDQIRALEDLPRTITLANYLDVEDWGEGTDHGPGPVTLSPAFWFTSTYAVALTADFEWPDTPVSNGLPDTDLISRDALSFCVTEALMEVWGVSWADLGLEKLRDVEVGSTERWGPIRTDVLVVQAEPPS